MASTRIQLSASELSILESLLAPRASDIEDLKLLVKIQKALVAVGGKPSNKARGASANNVISDGLSISERDNEMERLSMKMVNDMPLTEEEQKWYNEQLGITD